MLNFHNNWSFVPQLSQLKEIFPQQKIVPVKTFVLRVRFSRLIKTVVTVFIDFDGAVQVICIFKT